MDSVVVFTLFVFMLALLCFCVATVFSVNKYLYILLIFYTRFSLFPSYRHYEKSLTVHFHSTWQLSCHSSAKLQKTETVGQ